MNFKQRFFWGVVIALIVIGGYLANNVHDKVEITPKKVKIVDFDVFSSERVEYSAMRHDFNGEVYYEEIKISHIAADYMQISKVNGEIVVMIYTSLYEDDFVFFYENGGWISVSKFGKVENISKTLLAEKIQFAQDKFSYGFKKLKVSKHFKG